MKRFLILLLLAVPLYATDLREDTVVNVTLKWVDATDGVTPETTYTSTAALVCTLVKQGGTTATTLAIPGTNATAMISGGVAYLGLTATDTSTPGRLDLYCSCPAACITGGAAPFEAHFDVLPQVTWDQKYTGNIASVADIVAGIHGDPVPASYPAGTSGYAQGNSLNFILAGVATGGTNNTVIDTATLLQTATDHWDYHHSVIFTSGALAGQIRQITGFSPAADTITFSPVVPTAVTVGMTYKIVSSAINSTTDIANMVWAGVGPGLLDLADGVESGLTIRKCFRAVMAIVANKSDGYNTNTPRFRDFNDTKYRIQSTTNNTGRTSVTFDLN